jgi:hypothetical protein
MAQKVKPLNDKLKAAQSKVNETSRLYSHLLNSPDGELLMADLERRFGGTSLKKHDGTIDPYASIAAAGCHEVLLYINAMRKRHAVD